MAGSSAFGGNIEGDPLGTLAGDALRGEPHAAISPGGVGEAFQDLVNGHSRGELENRFYAVRDPNGALTYVPLFGVLPGFDSEMIEERLNNALLDAITLQQQMTIGVIQPSHLQALLVWHIKGCPPVSEMATRIGQTSFSSKLSQLTANKEELCPVDEAKHISLVSIPTGGKTTACRTIQDEVLQAIVADNDTIRGPIARAICDVESEHNLGFVDLSPWTKSQFQYAPYALKIYSLLARGLTEYLKRSAGLVFSTGLACRWSADKIVLIDHPSLSFEELLHGQVPTREEVENLSRPFSNLRTQSDYSRFWESFDAICESVRNRSAQEGELGDFDVSNLPHYQSLDLCKSRPFTNVQIPEEALLEIIVGYAWDLRELVALRGEEVKVVKGPGTSGQSLAQFKTSLLAACLDD